MKPFALLLWRTLPRIEPPLVALKAFSHRASRGLVHEVQQLAFSVRVLWAYFRHLLQELRA